LILLISDLKTGISIPFAISLHIYRRQPPRTQAVCAALTRTAYE
jgi:hypothetical protein